MERSGLLLGEAMRAGLAWKKCPVASAASGL